MNRLEMTLEETNLMQGILRGYLATLDVEIGHTDRAAFKRMLKERRSMVNRLLERCSELAMGEGVPDREIDIEVVVSD
jgi:hypothetical protein